MTCCQDLKVAISSAKLINICCIICRKHIRQSSLKEVETEQVTSEEQKVISEEEQKKKADSLWSGMLVFAL
jgi:hypothetical protein